MKNIIKEIPVSSCKDCIIEKDYCKNKKIKHMSIKCLEIWNEDRMKPEENGN